MGREERKEKYAIANNKGEYLIESNYHGNGYVVRVMTKEQCLEEIQLYYRGKGYSVKKIVS